MTKQFASFLAGATLGDIGIADGISIRRQRTRYPNAHESPSEIRARVQKSKAPGRRAESSVRSLRNALKGDTLRTAPLARKLCTRSGTGWVQPMTERASSPCDPNTCLDNHLGATAPPPSAPRLVGDRCKLKGQAARPMTTPYNVEGRGHVQKELPTYTLYHFSRAPVDSLVLGPGKYIVAKVADTEDVTLSCSCMSMERIELVRWFVSSIFHLRWHLLPAEQSSLRELTAQGMLEHIKIRHADLWLLPAKWLG